jgi:hypothetical protein
MIIKVTLILIFISVNLINAQYVESPREKSDSATCYSYINGLASWFKLYKEIRSRNSVEKIDSIIWGSSEPYSYDIFKRFYDGHGKLIKEEEFSINDNQKLTSYILKIPIYSADKIIKKIWYFQDTFYLTEHWEYGNEKLSKIIYIASNLDTFGKDEFDYFEDLNSEMRQYFYNKVTKQFQLDLRLSYFYENKELTNTTYTVFGNEGEPKYDHKVEFIKDFSGKIVLENNYLLDTINYVWKKVFYCDLYYKQPSKLQVSELSAINYSLTNEEINFSNNSAWHNPSLLEIYTIDGRHIKKKHFKYGLEGTMELDILPGIYFLKLSSGGFVQTIKFIRS